MSILSPFTGLLRSGLGIAQHEGTDAAVHSPLRTAVTLEEKFDHLTHALQHAAETADRQVQVGGAVARSVPALTEQVTALGAQVSALNDRAEGLNRQLDELVKLLAPVADAERDVTRVGRIFRRRHHHDGPHAAER